MAVAVPILLYASAAVTAISAVRQGQAAQAAATFNAVQSTQDAAQARSEALMQSIQVHRENVLRLGEIHAKQGAGGGTAAGSVLDVVADVAAQGELERQYTIYQGEAKARGYDNTATLDRMQGRAALDAGITSGVTAGLSGGRSASSAGRALTVAPQGTLRRVG